MTSQNPPSRENPDEVLVTVTASGARRFMGMVSLAVLGVLLIYVSITQSPELLWRVFMLFFGAASLWMADRMRRATASRIDLTSEALRDGDGTVITLLSDIEKVDRSFFAFKPSNGFLLVTRSRAANEWRPGLWWRIGRRIGVGGMTPASQTKQMSEVIAQIVAQRDLGR